MFRSVKSVTLPLNRFESPHSRVVFVTHPAAIETKDGNTEAPVYWTWTLPLSTKTYVSFVEILSPDPEFGDTWRLALLSENTSITPITAEVHCKRNPLWIVYGALMRWRRNRVKRKLKELWDSEVVSLPPSLLEHVVVPYLA